MFDKAISQAAEENPRLMTLAESVSFAVLIDRPFLRAARLKFVPEADASLEADFWFTPLIRTRTSDGVTMLPDAADELRRRVAHDPSRLQDVWALTTAMHAHLPQTLKLEEEIAYLSVSSTATERIETLLRSCLAAMIDGGRDQLANWSARLLANLPTSVRMLPAARLLDAGARLRLGGDASLAGSTDPKVLSWLTPSTLPRDNIGVRLAANHITFDATAEPRGEKMAVPRTSPLLLRVSWTSLEGEAQSAQVTLRRGERASVTVRANEFVVTTLTGESYSLRRGGTTPESVASAVIDFRDLIVRKSDIEVLGREKDLADIRAVIDARARALTPSTPEPIVLVTGAPGSGKTTLLARLAVDLRGSGATCFAHFFEPGRPRLEDFELARRSLIAQMISHFNLPSSMMSMTLDDFIQMASRRVFPSAPIVIILDNVDGVRGADNVDYLATLAKLPVPFVVVASTRPDLTTSVSLRVRTDWVDVAEFARKLYSLNIPRGPFGALDVIVSAQARFSTRFPNPRIESLASVYENEAEISPEGLPLLAALAVARAPLPFTDAGALASLYGVLEVGSAFITRFQHQDDLSMSIVNGAAADFLRGIAASPDVTKPHRDLASVVAPPDAPAEQFSWYGLMHGPFHWQRAGRQDHALQQFCRADLLQRRIVMFGARITANYGEEVVLGGNARGPSFDLLVAALRKNEARLDAAPQELVKLLYPSLREAGVTDADIRMMLSIPDETLPALRVVRRAKGAGSGFRLPARVSKLRALPKHAFLAALEDDSLLLFRPFDNVSAPVRLGSHQERVTALTGESDWAASGSADGSLYFWNVARPALEARCDMHQTEIVALLAGMDRCISCDADGTVAGWQMTRGSESGTDRWRSPWQARLDSSVTAATLASQSGLVAGCRDGSLVTLDPDSGRVVSKTLAHQGPVVAIAAWGSLVFSAGSDRTLRMVDLHHPEVIAEIPTGHALGIAGIAVSDLGKTVATWSADRTARVFSVRPWGEKAPLTILSPHRAAITSAAFLGQDALLTCSADGTAVVSRRNGDSDFRFEEHDAPIRACAVAWPVRTDPVVITASDDRRIMVWRGRDGVIISGTSPAVTRIGALSRGGMLIRRGSDVQIRIDNAETSGKADLAVSEDGRRFAVVESRHISLYRDASGVFGSRRMFLPLGPARDVTLASGIIFAATAEGNVDVYQKEARIRYPRHDGRIVAIQPMEGARGAVTGGIDGQVWLTTGGPKRAVHFGSHDGRVTAIGVSSEKGLVVSAADDDSLILWNATADGREVARGKTDIVRVRHIVFAKDIAGVEDAVIVAGDDGGLELFDLGLQRLSHIDAHRDSITGLCVDSRRDLFFTASADGTIRAWKKEGMPIATYYGDVPFTALALNGDAIIAGDEAGGLTWLSLGPPPAAKPLSSPKGKKVAARKKKAAIPAVLPQDEEDKFSEAEAEYQSRHADDTEYEDTNSSRRRSSSRRPRKPMRKKK